MFRLRSVFVATSLLGGCATGGEGPSLLPRPIERLALAVQTPEPTTVPTPLDTSIAARADLVVRRAQSADAAFGSLANALRGVIAHGGGAPPGSDPWVAAQNARSKLVSARQVTSAVLADLDALLTQSRPAGAATIAYVEARQRRIDALVARETAAIDAH